MSSQPGMILTEILQTLHAVLPNRASVALLAKWVSDQEDQGKVIDVNIS